MTEISVELQKEREKNSELLKKISSLEAQIKEKEKASVTSTAEEDDPSSSYRIIEEFKRQKIYTINDVYEDATRSITKLGSSHIESIEEKDINLHHPIVNWISFDETQFLSDKTKDEDSIVGFNEINDGDDEEYQGLSEINNGRNTKMDPTYDEKEFNRDQSRGILIVDDVRLHRNIFPTERSEIKKCHSKERKGITKDKEPFEIHHFHRMFPQKGSESLSSFKPLKLPFCPKEVKRIMECEALLSKNAQSHTIRKIIVFASLGIRHGYVDVYELDFSHFTILRKGEPYVSPKDPGEHVLYENPGVGKKVFYPNRKNPILCPVQVLEEEKLMRPSDPSCPSCLFLCIKYGGRTRNLPQNEYVRQRMGRNKLKSFGSLMCQMASLVHIRSGSFFFKALGITLLFMAGFPDCIVQRETKYRNLDLLQKYYRTDEEAEGEDLVHPYPLLDKPRIDLHNYFGKSTSSESTLQRKKQVPLITKPQNLQKSTLMSPIPSTTINPTPLGLKNYASTHTTPQPIKFHLPIHDLANATASILRINPMFSVYARRNPAVYPTFLPNPLTNRFVPLSFWHHPNYMYSSSYGYQCFPYSVNPISNGSRILCDHISEKHYFSGEAKGN